MKKSFIAILATLAIVFAGCAFMQPKMVRMSEASCVSCGCEQTLPREEYVAPYEVPPADYFVMDASRFADTFSFVRVVTQGIALGMVPSLKHEGKWETRAAMFTQAGSGFVIKDGYVFTAAHVVHVGAVCTPMSDSSSYCTEPFRMLHQEILLYDFKSEPTVASLHYLDIERDVAILKYDPVKSCLKAMPYIAEPPAIWNGLKVAAVVHERDDDGEMLSDLKVIYGTIKCDGVCDVPSEVMPWFNLWDMTLDLVVQPGDSGSPLFVKGEDGKPVVIGVVRAMSVDPYTGQYKQAYAVRFYRLLRYTEIVE